MKSGKNKQTKKNQREQNEDAKLQFILYKAF